MLAFQPAVCYSKSFDALPEKDKFRWNASIPTCCMLIQVLCTNKHKIRWNASIPTCRIPVYV